MPSVVVYGSLMHPQESGVLGIAPERMHKVVIQGYKRVFNQEPVRRKGHGDERALLNVLPEKEAMFNAILISGITELELVTLDEREQGYNRTVLPEKTIDLSQTINRSYMYTGKSEKRNDQLLPNNGYLDICLKGARLWGPDFYSTFLETTFVGGEPLTQWPGLLQKKA